MGENHLARLTLSSASIERVLTPDVTRDNRLEIGFRDVGGRSVSRRDIADESQMITGDENIDIDFVAFYIADAGNILLPGRAR